MKNFLLLTISSSIVLLTGCLDETKSLIVFDDIGVKNNTLGIYKNKKNANTRFLSLCYNNSKYYADYYIHFDDTEAFLQGNFVPSKVTGTDLYILSFPEVSGYMYDKAKKTKTKTIAKNAIVYYKIENNNFLLWMDFLSDLDEKQSSTEIKKIIKKSYSKTLTNGSTDFLKVGSCSSTNKISLKINEIKEKYSYFKDEK